MEQFAQPEIGTQIEVTVGVRNTGGKVFYHRPTTHTFIGTVLTPPYDIGPDKFALSGTTSFPVRVIQLDNVKDMRTVDGAELAKRNIVVSDVIEEQVAGSKGNVYTVRKQHDKWSCSCPGFQFRKDCKHVNQVKEKV